MIPRYRHPDPTYMSLWKWQKANLDQPILPALVDRCEELGMEEFGRVLDLCRVRGWKPEAYTLGGYSWSAYTLGGYSWSAASFELCLLLNRHVDSATNRYFFYSRSLCGCYAKLLHVPYGELEEL